ncbi:unnamed protein product [Menidia menidia]|uniref:GPI inositol-deacylase n=1 Tax=Menidia menidia TaxID=238744 RepID=A0A8S4AG19_9TELE|nr:unnamed protein product [Menidia menidia]
MKLASVAFYVLALGVLMIGLRELLTGFEENRCSMTYMFEYPEYRRVVMPRRIARLYPAYGLYLYGEGLYAQETRALKLTGAPVLFLPGNAGSYKQARSLGSVALRKAENMEGGVHLNVFTVDFNEELVALYGGSLRRQTNFLHESIKAILRLYKHLKNPPQSVVLVGHSMGGVVARALFTLPRFNTHLVSLIITQASPHQAPVLVLDPYLLGKEILINCLWCVHVVDLSMGTELLPPYKVLILSLSDLSTISHLVVSASNINGKQFTVECEWQRQESLTQSVAVPHVLSFGFTSSDVTVNSSGLLHTIQLQHFHQVYQAFRINIVSQCKVHKDRLPSVYRMMVAWFREDSLTTASVPSVTEISGMLHTSGPDNRSDVLLQLHTAPNCQYKVSIRTSLPKVLGQVLRFCGPTVPVYTAVTLLLACGQQLSAILKTGKSVDMTQAVGMGLQPHKLNLAIYVVHILLSCKWFQEVWSLLCFPPMDTLSPTFPDGTSQEKAGSSEEWPHLLSPLLYIFGAALAYWGSMLLRFLIRLISLIFAPLHRPSVSRDCGTLRLRTQLFICLSLTVLGGTSCGALAIFASSLFHLYRVLRLQMTERSLSHMLNLVPQKHQQSENGTVNVESFMKSQGCRDTPLLSENTLQDVKDDLQLHLSLSALFMLPVMLSMPSLVYWIHNLRYSTQLDPDHCWPHTVLLVVFYILLTNCNTLKLSKSKLLFLTSCLLLPLAITMVIFSSLHLYRVTYFLSAALVPLALCCLL